MLSPVSTSQMRMAWSCDTVINCLLSGVNMPFQTTDVCPPVSRTSLGLASSGTGISSFGSSAEATNNMPNNIGRQRQERIRYLAVGSNRHGVLDETAFANATPIRIREQRSSTRKLA